MNRTRLSARVLNTLISSRQGMKDILVSSVPQIVGLFVGFFSSVLIARGLGPERMGLYALVISLGGVATTLSDLGIGKTAIRYASRAAATNNISLQMSVLRWALRWRLSLVLLSTTAFFIIAPYMADLWRNEALVSYIRLGLLSGIFTALASVPTVYFQSIRKFTTNALVLSTQRIISFTGIVILSILSLWSIMNLIIVNLIVSAIGAIVFIFLVPKAALWLPNAIHKFKNMNIRRFFAGPKMMNEINNGLDSSTPTEFVRFHMLATVITMLSMQVGTWLMGYFLEDKSQIGNFSVATRFTLPMIIALGAFNTALWPRSAGLTQRDQLSRLLKKTVSLSVFLAFLMIIYSLTVPLLASFLFGSGFEKSQLIGQVLCLRYSFAMLICPVTIIGFNFGLVRIVWIINLIQLLLLIGVNVIFLQKIGSLASAYALLMYEVVGSCAVGFIILRRFHGLNQTEPITIAGP